LKRAQQDFGSVFRPQAGYRAKRRRKPRLIKFSASVFFQLRSEGRNNVERGMQARELFDHSDHAPIILERMQARPGKNVAARGRVAILRLMHVPQDHQVNRVHQFLASSCPAAGCQ
jgi:hypothetical protein